MDIGKTLQNINPFHKDKQDEAKDHRAKASDAAENTRKDINTMGGEAVKTVGKDAEAVKEEVAKRMDKTGKSSNKKMDEIRHDSKNKAKEGKDELKKELDSYTPATDSTNNKGPLEALGNAFHDAEKGMQDNLAKMSGTDNKSQAEKSAEKASNKANHVGKDIKGSVSSASKSTRDTGEDIRENVLEKLDNIDTQDKDIAGEARAKVHHGVEEAKPGHQKNPLEKIASGIRHNMPFTGSGHKSEPARRVENVGDDMSSAAKSAVQGTRDKADEIGQGATKKSRETGDYLKEKGDEAADFTDSKTKEGKKTADHNAKDIREFTGSKAEGTKQKAKEAKDAAAEKT